MDDETKIKKCCRQMYQAMTEKDMDTLSEVLDDSFVLVHMTGMRQSKEAFLRAVGNGALNYYSADHESIQVGQSGDQAALVGQSRVLAAVFGGGRHSWRLQQKIALTKQNDVWRMTLAEASTY